MSPHYPNAGVRVILVGATGLDGALRHDERVELIRARTPLDAIGELSDPIDAASPGQAVVIVGADVEPSGGGQGDVAEFIAGLRRVDPAVRVLRAGANGPALPAAYDGAIDESRVAERLREWLQEGDTREAAATIAEATVEPKPAPVPQTTQPESTPPAATAPTESPDRPRPQAQLRAETDLLGRMCSGEAILPAALALIRTRCGDESVEFLAEGMQGPRWPAWSSAPVHRRGSDEILGELRARAAAAATLESHAEWLGAWLELEHRQAELREAAYRDPLTGAWNRRYFDDFLACALERARTERRSLTVLVFDIDDFKRFNDAYGHGAGDEILTECVRLLQAAVRPTDKVCRIGGDEFAVIFHEPEGPREPDSKHPSSVFDIAERFRSQVRSARFRKLGDEAPGQLTISGGLATFPWDGLTAEELVERADELALEGKRQGKNVIAIGPGTRRAEA